MNRKTTIIFLFLAIISGAVVLLQNSPSSVRQLEESANAAHQLQEVPKETTKELLPPPNITEAPPAITETPPEITKAPPEGKPLVTQIPSQVRFPAGKPIPELFPYQVERDAIQALASTYDPKNIPKIAAYLDHADETVRSAAINGLIQIGSTEAIPHLKAAEAHSQIDEIKQLRQGIEFLSLPPAKIGDQSIR